MHNTILKEILSNKDKDRAKILTRFFKTGKGQYGEGDKFLGITVPISRKIAQKYASVNLDEISKLLKNEYHEIRLVALLILVHKYNSLNKQVLKKEISARQGLALKKKIVDFYLKNTKYINNWDLVDLSAQYILGNYLRDKNRDVLIRLSKSQNLWERRIAIISTFSFIYQNETKWTFRIINILLKDKHDLIQKACGWMLREVGKRVSEDELINYLDNHHDEMPRTMLRYAIERLPEKTRKYYLYL